MRPKTKEEKMREHRLKWYKAKRELITWSFKHPWIIREEEPLRESV